MGKYTAADGQYYCEPHYKQLVVSAGSLDDVTAKSTKAGGKTPVLVTSTPTSFVPVEGTSNDASSSIAANKQETPAHIAAKFKGGDSEKCLVCGARVYATERLPMDTASGQVVLHKACLKCASCSTKLEIGQSTLIDGKFYCKRHAKDQTSTAHSNAPGAILGDDAKDTDAAESGAEDGAAGGKFGGANERCAVCAKRVYATERVPIDTATGQIVLHKPCLKCADCSTKLEMGAFTLIEGKFYCKRHAKDHASTSHSNAPGAVLDDGKEKSDAESGAEDGAAGGKFGGANERCAVCSKRVYATERVPIDTATGQVVLHKPCLKCADCSTKLEVGMFTLIDSKFYCKRHAKDHASVSHSNTPGAIPEESGATSAKEGESGAEDAGKFGGAVERCAVCSKRVYATERMPIDGTNGQDILHKSCLKCADCQSVLKMDTFTRIDGAFYCKRHAKDHTSVSHNNAPGAIPDEKAAGGDAAVSDSERCLICKKKVFATERMPIDGVGDASVIHRTCLKCADCSTTLKVDTYTRIGDAFYCKRHAQDHASEYAPTATSGGAAKSGDAPAAGKSMKVDRDICPVCSKAVYATEKLIVSDAFDTKTLHKTCFRCKTCDAKLDMRTYVSVGDGSYYCRPHKPEILRAKGAGDMYAAYGSEYGADANGGSKPQSTAARLEAEGHAFQQEKKPDADEDDNKSSSNNNNNDNKSSNNKDDENEEAEEQPSKNAAESDNEEVAGGADEESEEKAKEPEPEPEPKKKEEPAAAAPAASADDDREARRAAREKARKDEEASAAASADADREARRAAREKARKDEEEAAAAADAERERKRAERRAAADAEAKKAEEEAEKAAAERKAKREAREKEAADEAAKAEKEIADRRAKREAEREKATETVAAADEEEGGDDDAADATSAKKGSKVRVRRRKDKS